MAPAGAISGSHARGFGIRPCLQESQRSATGVRRSSRTGDHDANDDELHMLLASTAGSRGSNRNMAEPGTPEEIVTVLSNEGFEACKREQTTGRRDRRPAGGLWQGVNPRTGSVASGRSG